jgi:peptidyl-prolyl cis-trans isomerase-like 4
MAVLIETSLGDFVVDLSVELAPKTCLNILKLCKAKYYNNALIFDVQKDYAAKVGHLDRDCSVFG